MKRYVAALCSEASGECENKCKPVMIGVKYGEYLYFNELKDLIHSVEQRFIDDKDYSEEQRRAVSLIVQEIMFSIIYESNKPSDPTPKEEA